MTFRDGVRLDPSRIQRRGAGTGSGGMAVGGGIGALVLLIVGAFFGVDLSGLGLGGSHGSTVTANDPNLQAQLEQKCTDAQAANSDPQCLVVGTINSLDAYWSTAAPAAGASSFTFPGVVMFDSVTDTPCGTASSQTGPFYCPNDQTIYIDTTFFDVLVQQYGSSAGPLAQEYVVAHEYGHHIQNLLGIFDKADLSGTGANSDSVKVELMADCLAGVWANHAATGPSAFLNPLSKQDVSDALQAARSVGDDRIQEATQGQANPDTFTHGTSQQRVDSFLSGYNGGTVKGCDTFGVVTQ